MGRGAALQRRTGGGTVPVTISVPVGRAEPVLCSAARTNLGARRFYFWHEIITQDSSSCSPVGARHRLRRCFGSTFAARLGRRPMYTIGRIPSGRLLALSDDDRRRHLYVIGKSGTGKSTLLYNFMREDLAAGRGFALLDPHGDLAVAIADSTPPSRTNDVLYLDPADPDYCAGFNILANVAPDLRPLVAAQTVSAFKNIWGDSWGPRLEYILTNALRLLLDSSGTTLLGLPRLLSDKGYRITLLRGCSDPVIRAFWQEEFESYDERFRKEAIAPIQNKVGALLSPPAIRNIVGQGKSTFSVRGIMDGGKVLIVNPV